MSKNRLADSSYIKVNHLSQGGYSYTVTVKIKGNRVTKTFDLPDSAEKYRDMLVKQKSRLERGRKYA